MQYPTNTENIVADSVAFLSKQSIISKAKPKIKANKPIKGFIK